MRTSTRCVCLSPNTVSHTRLTGLMHTFRAILALALASSVCADTHSGTKRILAVSRGLLEQCTEQSFEIGRQSDFMQNETARHLLWHAVTPVALVCTVKYERERSKLSN